MTIMMHQIESIFKEMENIKKKKLIGNSPIENKINS